MTKIGRMSVARTGLIREEVLDSNEAVEQIDRCKIELPRELMRSLKRGRLVGGIADHWHEHDDDLRALLGG